ncbi:decarboxylase [Halioglobus japonicus]|uniref:Decarboxylase n=1 Tax=Halioglobus japonicus TaxID=930805 RepID=A0AAP8SPM7_9GAMM|nr:malonyl-CoA decarboxylase [Halioglobus japonicus]PLW87333.1 decarboxylase [Halioglobus japonicus]GHD08975.1 decarboxylase [Halioglobus japonicus]
MASTSPIEKDQPNTSEGSVTVLGRALSSVITAGREILARRRPNLTAAEGSTQALVDLCKELIEHRGEASGLALAQEITEAYLELSAEARLEFFQRLASDFDIDREALLEATERYRDDPDYDKLQAITRATEAPRQKLFRRINMAPGGTRTLVALRGELLQLLRQHPELKPVDSDLKHLFIQWFNKGFLELRNIDWASPAVVLEKLIDYEAVHEINGWEDLRGRLREDRRCFAFFHPAMGNDPLVFVEVALVDDLPDAIAPLIDREREIMEPGKFNTVVFYSISNCHPGLAGVSFGNFLIKNVVEVLKKEIEGLKTFVTLSPVPGFRRWLNKADLSELVDEALIDKVRAPVNRTVMEAEVQAALTRLCAHYLVREKSGELAKDPVARFHLGNGARLHRLHWGADLTPKGLEQSGSIMVNYLYDLDKIEINHEEYFDEGKISAAKSVLRQLPQD